ncbi:unnamed protein product [Aphis gossypii]|uniref:Uncharacterized protein n=1 Tax=Aphis gossypii TaxID=80765 RepID=A0A9P0INX4_APHGO|nr:unnamed protein product [Aphis gossypii]
MVDRSPASSCWASCPPLLLSSSPSPPPSSPRALSRAPARVLVAAAAGNRFRRAQLSKRRRAHRCRFKRYHNNCDDDDDDDWSRRRAGYYFIFFFQTRRFNATVAGRPARLRLCRPRSAHNIILGGLKATAHRPAGERGFVCGDRRSGTRSEKPKTRRLRSAVRARALDFARPPGRGQSVTAATVVVVATHPVWRSQRRRGERTGPQPPPFTADERR